MPGNVANAVASTVLPRPFCSVFTQSREWLALVNEYENGESQRHPKVATSRKSWQLTAMLTPTQLTALRTFIEARQFIEAFWFYDFTETVPRASYDATGTATVGRYKVVARGPWKDTVTIPRSQADLQLIEVA